MIKRTPTSKVYVYAPAKRVTGGVELLHQLVHYLNTFKIEAYIVYLENNNIVDVPIPNEYSNYTIKVSTSIEDLNKNIVVICEGIFNNIYSTNEAQILCWWLSVDNFYICSQSFLSIKDMLSWNLKKGIYNAIKRTIKILLNKRKRKTKIISIKKLARIDVLHCYQSEYAKNFLVNKNMLELLPLSDFINIDFAKGNDKIRIRENKILYNPAKGYEYTKKLINKTPHLKWVPLVGMTREQLINEFQTSKLYVDFGYHPGKDRIPREAVLNGCTILTNTKGSAKFFEDIPIARQYKINQNKTSLNQVINKIEFMLNNFEVIKGDFEFYRKRILNEEKLFKQQIKDIFDIE